MSDMADMAIDETMDMEDLRLEYHLGSLTHKEAYEAGIIDERGFEYSAYAPRIDKCKYCGKPNLQWYRNKSGWRLFNGAEIHSCAEYDFKK